MEINFYIEEEIPQLRFANIECPYCKYVFDAFSGKDDSNKRYKPSDCIDLKYSIYECPSCYEEIKARNNDCNFIHSVGGRKPENNKGEI